MTPQIWITLGYGLSGILPLIALWRRARINGRLNDELDAAVAARGHAKTTIGDVNAKNKDIRTDARAERRNIAWEVFLVGVGGVTLASITSIFAVWVL